MVDKLELADLREEVAYWRKDAAARAWAYGVYMKAAKDRGNENEAIQIKVGYLDPTLAAIDAAKEKRWHSGCTGCGKPLLNGQIVVIFDEGERCHMDCNQPNWQPKAGEAYDPSGTEVYDDGFSPDQMDKMIAFAREQARLQMGDDENG